VALCRVRHASCESEKLEASAENLAMVCAAVEAAHAADPKGARIEYCGEGPLCRPQAVTWFVADASRPGEKRAGEDDGGAPLAKRTARAASV